MNDLDPRKESRLSAAKAGRTRFYGGRCKTCGEALRQTANGACANCLNKRSSEYQRAIRETLRASKEAVGGRA